MTITLAALTLACCVGAVTAGPAPALEPAWADCNTHGRLTHTYTAAQLQDSLAHMPADVLEYTNCSDVLHQALQAELANLRASGGAGGSGGSFLPTPVIVVLVILLLAAGGLGAVALRRRREDAGGGETNR
jgi:hypothetical protein